jgi:succinate dehydrogenase/fumarate reductase cytochrome b subunit
MTASLTLVRAHRILAVGLAVFILVHLATHLTAVMGPQAHVAVLKATQGLYRNPFVEPVLIAAPPGADRDRRPATGPPLGPG